MTETYIAAVECRNCGNREVIEIAKGITKDVYLKDHKCPRCGCKTTKDVEKW